MEEIVRFQGLKNHDKVFKNSCTLGACMNRLCIQGHKLFLEISPSIWGSSEGFKRRLSTLLIKTTTVSGYHNPQNLTVASRLLYPSVLEHPVLRGSCESVKQAASISRGKPADPHFSSFCSPYCPPTQRCDPCYPLAKRFSGQQLVT